jgi:hypothetical protein
MDPRTFSYAGFLLRADRAPPLGGAVTSHRISITEFAGNVRGWNMKTEISLAASRAGIGGVGALTRDYLEPYRVAFETVSGISLDIDP